MTTDRGIVILLAVAVGLTVLAADAQAQAPQAERPVYAVGDVWIRSDGVYEMVRIQNDRYVFAARPGQEFHLTRNLGIARIERGGHFFEFEPPAEPTWPLRLGKIGSVYGTWRNVRDPGGVQKKFTWSVDRYEDVQVAGTTLKAFMITLQIQEPGSYAIASRWNREIRMWYAPEARQYVRFEAEVLGALVNFSVVSLDRPKPLALALDQPARDARLHDPEVTLAGRAVSGRSVQKITVAVNGKEAGRREPRQRVNEIPFRIPVRLVPGRNVVLVTATGGGGETVQEALTLFHEPPAVAADPRPGAAAGPPPAAVRPPGSAEPRPDAPRLPPPVAAAPPPTAPRLGAPAAPFGSRAAVNPGRPPAGAQAVAPAPTPTTPATPPRVAATPPPAATPLEVALSSPADQAAVAHDTVVLAGVVSSGTGVSRVVVTVNGAEVSRVDEKAPRPAVALNLPLRLREGANTVVVTATDVGGRPLQEVRTVHYDPVVPLGVAVRYPEERAELADASTVLVAAVASSKGVAKASVTLNGVEVPIQAAGAAAERPRAGGDRSLPRSMSLTVPLTLRPGTNVIVVSAAESDGTLKQEVRTVVYQAPAVAAIPAAPVPPPREPGRWAVVIGVGGYDNPDIPRLKYSVRDAEAVHQALLGAGFRKEHIVLLTDATERKPTLKNIKWALGTFLARSARKDDIVIIYFAGHGAPEVDPRGLERDGLAKYLIPSDAEPDDLYSSALPMDELQTIFGRVESERVIAFLDACYSGGAGGRSFASRKTRAGHVDDLFLERLTRSKGRAIVTASRPAEVSVELPELGHGIFTYYLVQGLKGAGDLNRDGIVSLQELYEYLEQQVTRKARAAGGNQHPVMKGELEGVLPLVKVGGR